MLSGVWCALVCLTGRSSVLRPRPTSVPLPSRSLKPQCSRKTNSKFSAANLAASQHVPSAVHYVGYVEEDETPEMIMAKFAELEEIQRKASEAKEQDAKNPGAKNPADGEELGNLLVATADGVQEALGLTDEQLLQVFKQTSMFNVKTALQDNAMLTGIDDILGELDGRYGSDDDFDSEDEDMLNAFWSDDEDWDGGKRRCRRGGGVGGGGGGAGGSRNSKAGHGVRREKTGQVKARHQVVTAYNPLTQALVRKKVKVNDPNQLEYVRIPNPLPLSWGRTIRPFVRKVEVEDVAADGADGNKQRDVVAEAVLVNEAWYKDGEDTDQSGTKSPISISISRDAMKRLSAVSFNKVVPYGFVFVWTPKELIMPVCKLMSKQGFAYVENLTWVWMQPNNTIAEDASAYIGRSHSTLYMFRATCADRSKVELRHQRSPDVIFDYRKDGGRCPTETYEYLETLLPKSTKEGKLVELFAKEGVNAPRRKGWKVVEYDFAT